jgi:hypothetical protein
MKKLVLIAVVAGLPLCAQSIDFKMLDKLGEKAKESSVVNLGPEQLGLVTGMSGGQGKQGIGDIAKALKSVQVRSYEFEEKGQYDVEIVRAFRDKVTSSGNWVNIISTKEKGGFTDIMMQKGADGKSSGLLIVAAEAREVSIVHIDGPLDLSSIGKLGGVLGIPELAGGEGSGKSSGTAKPKGEKEEEEEDEI